MIRPAITALAILIQVAFFLASLVGIYLTIRLGLYWIGPLTLVFWVGTAIFVVAAMFLGLLFVLAGLEASLGQVLRLAHTVILAGLALVAGIIILPVLRR